MSEYVKRGWRARASRLAVFTATALVALPAGAAVHAQGRTTLDPTDPRTGLGAGLHDAASAIRNLVHVSSTPRPTGFFDPASIGDPNFANTDLAFSGDLVLVGNYAGFQLYDVSDPTAPRLRTAVICPGGQGDISVHRNLVFMSVEQTSGRIDCGRQGVAGAVSDERFRGVRVFDISDADQPRQVAAVQTCRGSHTHTLVTSAADPDNVYVYVSGTSSVRDAAELEGCSALPPDEDPNTSYFRIEVIRVPLAAPQDARVVSAPRVFADRETGDIAGLWQGGDHGEGTQRTARTDRCHDITAFPALGLAAGACSGNGIMLDISDPVNPVRIQEVTDPNFAYWHSATFSNDGRKLIFTDEWGGGRAARCLATDQPEWGANAIFDVIDGELRLASYYKLPAPQTEQENCVAHNGSLVPVPGRDIKVQAWYQGGISIFDFTDSANPVEIAWFDRGPVSATELVTGGYWSAYWHNGRIYGSEILRGLDVFELRPSDHLSQNEIDAALLVRFDEFNPQTQPRFEWPAAFVVARAYVDQLARSRALPATRLGELAAALQTAERTDGAARQRAAAQLGSNAGVLEVEAEAADVARRPVDARRMRLLAGVLRDLSSQ